VQEPLSINYNASANKIVINANLPRNEPYRVNVKGALIQSSDGGELDGFFNGANAVSGDGSPGSNFKFDAAKPTGSKVARFYTSAGPMNVQLYSAAQLPKTIPNFLYYVNTGAYDNTIIHRSTTVADSVTSQAPGYAIVQGGGYYVDASDQFEQVPITQGNIPQETSFPDAAGTLAMTNAGQPDTTQNQWYFNVSDNTSAFGARYSVFGKITTADGLAVLSQLDSYPTIDVSSQTRLASSTNQVLLPAFTNLPVVSASVTPANVNLASDLLTINRVALKMTLSPVPSEAPSVAVAGVPAGARAVNASDAVAISPSVSAAGSGVIFGTTPVGASAEDLLQSSGGSVLE
jgi:cyclophilin family peptidyl-prolyl cis-trans isomerase